VSKGKVQQKEKGGMSYGVQQLAELADDLGKIVNSKLEERGGGPLFLGGGRKAIQFGGGESHSV